MTDVFKLIEDHGLTLHGDIEHFAELVRTEKQEPYGYFRYDIQLDAWVQDRESTQGVAFYTAPPKREWVGLTEDDMLELNRKYYPRTFEVMIATEEKLKEKNDV
jgi:hypothetical protein